MLRTVFLGTSEFAVPSLRAVSEMTLAVVSMPDRPAGRGRKLRRPPAACEAEELGIPLLQPEKLTGIRETIESLKPDVMVSASYGGWLPDWFLKLAPFGVVNVHPSLLPRHRGAAPVVRTILEGDTHTGVSFMLTDSGWDTGDLLRVSRCQVPPGVTAGELEDQLADMAGKELPSLLNEYTEGRLSPTPQEGPESYAGKITTEESRIDWRGSAVSIERAVRAFNPVPGARTAFRGRELKIFGARVDPIGGTPGTVVSGRPLVIACGESSLVLTDLQPQGKKRMSGEDFVRGYRPEPGDSLG